MNQLLKNKVLDDKDRKHIQTSSEMFSVMSEKYKKVLDKQKHENEKIKNIYHWTFDSHVVWDTKLCVRIRGIR